MLWKILRADQPPPSLFFPLAASSVTLVTTFVYYLKWNDRWFREHADAEFNAKRYKADILRASWIAELVGEWERENPNRELPAQLVEAFARNLFRDIGSSSVNEHPLDELMGLMKRATSISIGQKGFSLSGLGSTEVPK